MAEFWIDLPAAREAAGELAESANELEAQIAVIAGAANGVLSCLSDASATGISEQLRGLSEELAQQKRNIEAMASVLFDVCDLYEKTDEEVAASANACNEEKTVLIEEVESVQQTYGAEYVALTPGMNDVIKAFSVSPIHNKEMRDLPQEKQNFARFINDVSGRIIKRGTSNYEISYPNGYVGYDWVKIENVLKKPADEITTEEYLELSALFLDMDNADATKFLKLLTNPKKTVHVADSAFIDHNPNDYTVWTVDDEKIQKLQIGMMIYSDLYDTYNLDIKELKAQLGFDVFGESEFVKLSETMENKQNAILQKSALLDTLAMCGGSSDSPNGGPTDIGSGYFTSEANAKGPDISVKKLGNGSIELSYNTDGRNDHLISKTVTVGKVSDGSLGTRNVIEESNNYYVDRFSTSVTDALQQTAISATNLLLTIETGGMSVAVGAATTTLEEGLSAAFGFVDDKQDLNKQGQFYSGSIVAENNKDFGLKSVPVTVGTGSSEKKMTLTYPTGKTGPTVAALDYVVTKKINPVHYGLPSEKEITYKTIIQYPQEIHNLLIGKPLEGYKTIAKTLPESDVTYILQSPYLEMGNRVK